MTTENTYDSGDEKHVAKAKQKQHNDTQAEVNDLRAIMDTRAGRQFMWRLLGKCGVYRQSFDTNELYMAMKEGKRSIGLELVSKLTDSCLDKYQLMEKEQRELNKTKGN